MTAAAAETSRPGEGEAPGREHGVLLRSGLVMPAATEAVAREQAARLGAVHCLIGDDAR